MKAIPGYDGYFATEEGEIFSLKFGRTLLLKQRLDKSGRPCLNLWHKGVRKQFNVHTLVMLTFVGECPEGLEVCHYDGNKQNNCLTNLRYDTKANNHLDKLRHKTQPTQKLSEQDVIDIRWTLSMNTLKEISIAEMYGVSRYTISRIRRNTSWSHLEVN